MMQMNALSVLLVYTLIAVAGSSVYARELPTPNKFGGDFRFQSTLGKPITIRQFQGKVVLLNFGFTSCPDVCPMVLSELATVKKTLDNDTENIQVIFVTVDPERDSLDKLQQYLGNFHTSFVGMRGENLNVIRAVMKRYGAALVSEQGGKEIDISHSDYVYIINRDGYVSGFYDIQSRYDELVTAVRKAL